jgi:hypothetical protein
MYSVLLKFMGGKLKLASLKQSLAENAHEASQRAR